MTTPFQLDFPELSQLSRDDLEDLLNDPSYYDAILHTLPRVQQMNLAQNEIANANEAIAKKNMELSHELHQLREETKQAYNEAQMLKARWKELEREQNELYSRYAPSFLLLRLKHDTTKQDDHSEAVATGFVKSVPGTNSSDVDDFVREFRELRKVYHKRKMWADQWSAGKVQWREY